MQAVIPCGGRATRLKELAARTPKILVEVAGQPLAHRILAQLARAGFTEVVLCVGHLGGMIRAALDDGERFGLRVVVVDEGDRALGTWGAVRGAADHLAPAFLVTYGDSLLPLDLAESMRSLAESPWALGVMTTWRNQDAVEPSNAAVEGDRVIRFAATASDRAKPGPLLDAIDYGAIALRREAVLRLDEGRAAPLGTLFASLATEGRLGSLPVTRRFHEIGTPAGLAAAEAAIRRGELDVPGGAAPPGSGQPT